MKKSLSAFHAFLALLLAISSVSAVTGRVVDVGGKPISGATISLIKASISTTTKSDGTFDLKGGSSRIVSTPNEITSLSTQLMQNGKVRITMPKSSNVEIFAVNLLGKGIGEFRGYVEQGTHEIPLLSEQRNAELVILRCKTTASKSLKRMNSRSAIDTLRLSKPGFATLYTHIDSMSENLGTMVLNASSLPATDFYRLKFLDSGNTKYPNLVEGRIQILDSKNIGVTGLEGCPAKNLCEFRVDNIPVDEATQPTVIPYWKPYTNQIRLVLDRGNAMPAATFDSLKAAVKYFVRAQSDSMNYVLFTFGTVVDTLVNVTQDTAALFAAIDGMARKGNTNNIHGALRTALSYQPYAEFTFRPPTIVAFTDGLDDEGAYTKDDIYSMLKDIQIWMVAGTWNLFSVDPFKTFADERVISAGTAGELRSAFRNIHTQHRIYESSFYRISYKSPLRNNVAHKLELRILTNTNTGADARDTIYFNSKDFADGYAPTAKNIQLKAVPNRGLRVTYEYYDADGDPEGETKMNWQKATTFGNWQPAWVMGTSIDSLTIDTSSDISYQVFIQACQKAGTPLCGIAPSPATIHFTRPFASRLFLKPQAFPGKTLEAKYVYTDLAGRSEGATKIQWYRDGAAISGATSSSYKVLPSDTGKYLSFSVTPVAVGSYTTVGSPVKSEEVLAHGTTMVDTRTGHEYPTVTIGAQTWMTQNLRTVDTTSCDTSCWRNGTMMKWSTAVAYSGTAANYDENNRVGSCPAGWHVPTNNEWDALYTTVRSLAKIPATPDSAGFYLKSRKGWLHPGNDLFRFNSLPTGTSAGDMNNGYWWSASHTVSGVNSLAHHTILLDGNTAFTRSTITSADLPLRCVKDY